MAKGKNKPQIRFNEFTDVWEQRELKSITSVITKGTTPLDKSNSGTVNFIKVENIDNSSGEISISQKISKEEHEGYLKRSQLQENDILFSIAGTLGRVTSVNSDILPANTNQALAIIRLKECNLDYIKTFLKSKAVTDYIKRNPTVGAQPNLSLEQVGNLEIQVPSLREQQSIGNYFKSLDNLITLHQRKYDQMVSVKKSMLEKLFVQDGATAPQIRFGDFTAPWRQVHLGDIVIPYADPVETPHNGYERLGIRSHGKGVFHEYVEAGKELDTAHMHRVASHNLIVNITFAWEHAVAITTDSDEGKLVSHRFPQFSMSDTIYDQFLKYLILDAKFRHHLLLSSPGGAGRNRVLKVPEMLEYEMMIPEIEEQRQIASYLNSLDDLIELYRIRLEKMKNIKTACLQKMFV